MGKKKQAKRNAVIPAWPEGIDNFQPWPHLVAGQMYGLGGVEMSMSGDKVEEIGNAYDSLAGAGFQSNGIVFACEMKRIQIFSQARFMWQSLRKGQPDNLFGTPALDILAHPWPSGTTVDLLTRIAVHADFGGNSFIARRGSGQLRCLRPNWVDMVLGSYDDPDLTSEDIDAEFLGIVYYPGGKYSGSKGEPILRSELAHFAPIPDPRASHRGMAWISPIVREVMGDGAMTTHKLKFHENAGTPNLVIKRQEPLGKDSFDTWVAMMEQGHKGLANAYKTLYLTAGADATVVGADLRALDFKIVQGAGETRIAAAAGVHPVLVGLSEGMQGAALNAGNFNSARRSTADTTAWHWWSNLCGSLEAIVPPPNSGARLWIDPDMPFLREDRKDAAEIKQIRATTLNTYLTAGYTPDSAVKALVAEDESMLKHSGLLSVQLQEPGATAPVETVPPKPTNGTKPKVPSKAT
jgi:portal protein